MKRKCIATLLEHNNSQKFIQIIANGATFSRITQFGAFLTNVQILWSILENYFKKEFGQLFQPYTKRITCIMIIFGLKDLWNSKENHAWELSSSFQQEILRQIMQVFFRVNIRCEYTMKLCFILHVFLDFFYYLFVDVFCFKNDK